MKYIESLREGLEGILSQDEKTVILGEDIGEPYGGAFKVTKSLEEKYPQEVISTPMSESGLTGIITGMAIKGYKPILEIMFGDFMTLCVDQVVNHASKFKFLFEQDLNMVIRTPMGGYRGYGATHSQTIEKLFFGFPNINIFAPNILLKPGELLKETINYNSPVIFVENKLDYSRNLIIDDDKYEIKRNKDFNLIEANVVGEKEFDGYLITYGGMVDMALDIMWQVFLEEEITLKLLIPTIISPLSSNLLKFIDSYKDIYVLEEGSKEGGFNSEVARILLEENKTVDSYNVYAAKNEVIAASKILEEYVLPDKKEIIGKIIKNSRRRRI